VLTLVMLAVQPSAVRAMTGAVLPVDWVKVTPPAANFGIAIARACLTQGPAA